MKKLIYKKNIPEYKKKLSKAIDCKEFEPDECCFCHEIDRFVNELAEKEHNPQVCQ